MIVNFPVMRKTVAVVAKLKVLKSMIDMEYERKRILKYLMYGEKKPVFGIKIL